jgi:hypothetical protein
LFVFLLWKIISLGNSQACLASGSLFWVSSMFEVVILASYLWVIWTHCLSLKFLFLWLLYLCLGHYSVSINVEFCEELNFPCSF